MTGLPVVESFRVVVLVAVALVLVYPTVVHARNVMHTDAIRLLTAVAVVLAASVVVQAAGGPTALSEGLQLVVAAGLLASCWLFAREFVGPDPTAEVLDPVTEDAELAATGEGFEDVERE